MNRFELFLIFEAMLINFMAIGWIAGKALDYIKENRPYRSSGKRRRKGKYFK